MPGTNLPKKPLNQFGQKQFWQVCASATSRNARAAAKKEACRFVDGKTQSFCAPAQRAITALPKSGSLEPKRFKRAFGDFSLTGKVTRPAGRNTSLSLLPGTKSLASEREISCCPPRQEPAFESTNKKIRPPLASRSYLVGEGGFEPPKSLTTDLQSAPFGHSGIPPYSLQRKLGMELVDGLEPPTC